MHSCLDRTDFSRIEALALGGFDGLHLGHRALIEALGENGALLAIENSHMDLTPGCVRQRFSPVPVILLSLDRVCNLSPQGFIAYLKEAFPQLKRLVAGYDFRFGKERSGAAADLARLFEGTCTIVDQVTLAGEPVHATAIRHSIREGHLGHAAKLLGRPHILTGSVIRGQGLGMRRLYPTLNLEVRRFLIPAEGVYVTFSEVKGVCHPSVSFIGHRVSTDGSFAVETHLLSGAPPEEAAEVTLWFEKRLRPNHRFDNLERLKAQIETDIAEAKTYLENREPPCTPRLSY
jgi:riboflavin kinase/FMN adenylyltransferase